MGTLVFSLGIVFEPVRLEPLKLSGDDMMFALEGDVVVRRDWAVPFDVALGEREGVESCGEDREGEEGNFGDGNGMHFGGCLNGMFGWE